MEIFLSIMLIIGITAICICLSEMYDKSKKNLPSCDELTNEEEIIILLKNIAENQRKIRTNTTIIAIIMLMPIIIGIMILLMNIAIIDNIIRNII